MDSITPCDADVITAGGLIFIPPGDIALTHEGAIEALIRLCELELEHRVDELHAAIMTRDAFAHMATAEDAARVDAVIDRLFERRARAADVVRLVRGARGVQSFIA